MACVYVCWYFFCAFFAATVAVSASVLCLCRGLASRFSPLLYVRVELFKERILTISNDVHEGQNKGSQIRDEFKKKN